jgi:murein DD-endopeptidase MepM/ murein hydrolase activator NlpD
MRGLALVPLAVALTACSAAVPPADGQSWEPSAGDDGATSSSGGASSSSGTPGTGGGETTGDPGSCDALDCPDGPEDDDGTGSTGSTGAPVEAGFGYPVGDKTTAPAGGWVVTQVLGHYLNTGSFVGGHLAQDIAAPTEGETANAPVHAIGDGTVLYAGSNTSTYVNVVLVEHDLGDEGTVCSFYGHLGSVAVGQGAVVKRGDTIATVLDWNAHFGAPNSHLHYVVLSADLCAASAAAGGALVCGYDDTPGPNGIETLADEPYAYTSVGDVCGDHNYPDAFMSPSQFIAAHPPG